MMKRIWAIAMRDFRAYFASPMAYIIAAMFLVIMGWMFYFSVAYFLQQNLQFTQFGMGKSAGLNEYVVRPFFANMNVIFLFILPFVAMRLLAEEKKMHTIELLLTAPVRLSEIVLGKFVSSVMFVKVLVFLGTLLPLMLFMGGKPDLGSMLAGVVGNVLLASCYLAIGLFASSTTSSQIVAGVICFAVSLFFWLVNWAAQNAGPVFSDILNHLSLMAHYNNFGQGLIHSSDVIYYLTFIGFFLFLTHRVLDSYRWR